MKRALVLLALFAATALADDDPARVTLGLTQYETMRKTSESPSATVIDTLTLGGSFRDRSLTLTLAGKAVGARPSVKVIDGATDVTISDCSGDAILTRTAKGSFDLIALKDAFSVRCALQVSGSDRLAMHVLPAVLAVRANVTDGELVSGDEDDSGARGYTLVRHVAGPGETLPATATGRYLITLLPDATRFAYSIDVHNPNRTVAPLDVALQSNEHLQQIDASAPYDVNGNRYVFAMPPGDSTIAMSGELRGASFTAPVKATLQYVVIESHPLLRPAVKTTAKRISLGETGLTPSYRGALAFETASEPLTWQVTRLEALHTISYAVTTAKHALFLPVDGPVLGETTLAIRNEGAAELVLPPLPEPTYVALQNEPVLMTKDKSGKLTVPLSTGEQQVLVQHRQPVRQFLGFAFGRLQLPRAEVAATDTQVSVRFPDEWRPLYSRFAHNARAWAPDGGDLVLFLFLAIWSERLLAAFGVTMRRRFPLAIAAALAASFAATLMWVLLVLCALLTLVWAIPIFQREKWSVLKVVAGLGVLFVVLLFVIVASLSRHAASGVSSGGSYGSEVATDTVATNGEPLRAKAAQKVEEQNAPANPEPAYAGLPARFTLPGGVRGVFYSQELLPADRPQFITVVAISSAFVQAIAALLALVALALLWRERKTLAASIRAKLTPPVPVIEEPAAT